MHRAPIVAAAAAGVLAAGMVLAGAGPAVATPTVLYAAVTATGTGDCSAAADACTLSTALKNVVAGGVIKLITPGGATAASRYVGNWTVATRGTSATAPVTIEAAPGLASQPVLDGNKGASTGCSTAPSAPCNGPVLTVPGTEHVVLSGITIADGNNASTGGGLDNAGTVTITSSIFTGNTAHDGGAIDSGDAGGGSLAVTASTFAGNTASFGGAIDSGDGFNGGGTVRVTASTFSGNSASFGGAIDSGDSAGGGSVTVTASTFSGNTAAGGGAIDSGDGGGGSVTVTASTFSGNRAVSHGGAIDSGDETGGGSVTVTASTFAGNTAVDGGAIDSGDSAGGGSVTVTASTFARNTAGAEGGAIDSGDSFGRGTMQVAGDVFDGSCHQPGGGTWSDGGYNAGTDASCFASSPPASDKSGSTVGSDLQTAPTGNGGPTKTIAPTTGNPAIALIPDPTTITLGSSHVVLCPAVDQRGYPSAAKTGCDAGAVQTSGRPPALTLKDTAHPGSFNRAGQVITYSDTVTNAGAGTLTAITVTDPAVPFCPTASLAPRASHTCTHTRTVTRADLAAGTITDTATATGATANGVPVASNPATVTLHEGWPPAVTGIYRPHPHQAKGYYLGVTGSTWSLTVTHPGSRKVVFTGTITLNAGAFRHVSQVDHESGDSVHVHRQTLTFRFTNYGFLDGVRFTTTPADTTITFTLTINGHHATARQIHLGRPPHQARHGSPLTFRR